MRETMRALPPIDERDDQGEPSHDKAKDGYSLRALERLLQDCEDQPAWRDASDLCCLYYDVGGVFDPMQEFKFLKAGLVPRKTNLVGRVINGVLGQEAKTRRDPRIEPDDDEGADVADVLNVKLKEAQREACADMAISNAYASQVKAGIGWVEVSKDSDPLEYGIRVQEVHRSQIWWDWRAKTVDLKDARWLVRREWKDLDEVVASFPEHKDILVHSAGNWSNWLLDDMVDERVMTNTAANDRLSNGYKADRSFRVNRAEWIDGGRQRVRMYEVWYRVPAEVVMMRVGNRLIQVDLQNPLHREAISRGMVKIEKRITSQVRMALFAGPYRLIDKATTKRRFPYIPFFAFRADADYTPYGLVHGMLAPQDEYNERRMRIQWMLKAQQLHIDSDALDKTYNNINDITETMMNPDMVAVLNPERRNKDGMQFKNDFALQSEQFEMMQDSKNLIQDVSGVYSTQLGDAPAGVTANSAINSLIDQGLVAMGELNDNYGHARRMVYDSMVELIAEQHMERDMRVAIGAGQTRRVVVLNTFDPQTKRPLNNVADVKVNTGLAEVPATPAYMAQMSTLMGEMVRALAGTPQGAMILPAWVENTSAFGPSRKQMADDMRRSSGLPVSGDRAGAQQWQAQQMQAAQRQAQLAEQAAQLEMEKTDGEARLTVARADLAQAQTAHTLVQAEKLATEPDEEALIREALAEAAGQPPMQQPQQQAMAA